MYAMGARHLSIALLSAAIACTTSSGTDAGNHDAGEVIADSGSGPASDVSADQAALTAQAAAASSMATSALASLIAEIAADDYVAPFLSLQSVPQLGDPSTDRPRGVTVTATTECAGAGGAEHLDRCPSVIVCPRQVVLAYGLGCQTASGKHVNGLVRIAKGGDLAGAPWSWQLAVSLDNGDSGRIGISGALQMTHSGSSLVFNQRSDGLTVRMPDRDDRTERGARDLKLLLSDISLDQQANGDYLVRGPDTYTLPNVPVTCNGMTQTISLTVEACGGWQWAVPLSSCLCPTAGELRVSGPILNPCGTPPTNQTLAVQFQPLSASKTCGNNLTATLYLPDTQCPPSCGACNKGVCVRGVCTNAVDMSSVASGMIGWVCNLPSSVCSAISDAGVSCPSDGSDRSDANRLDTDAAGSRDGAPMLDGDGGDFGPRD
jgi:hypothetical protein